ncbi:MAG TPA: PPC domain-containing protein, partial [Acidobacteriota bacterium]|nr:PPC domain-containing protein [Acidobacteriota bacterium]
SGTIPPGIPSNLQCTLNQTQYTISVPTGSSQLIVTLDGPSGGDVDLYVRKGQPVGDTGFSNPFISDYASQGGTPHERVYVGPNSNLPLSAGTYYIGVSNCAATVASFTLAASVITPASPVKIEELVIDNGNPEDFLNPNGETSFPPNGANGVIVVNKLTPSRYPSKLTGIRIRFDTVGVDQSGNPIDPTGQSVRLVAFSDPSGSGAPPAAPVLQVDQVVTIPGVGSFADFSVTNPPVIQSGDWYVGVQQPASFNGFLVSLNKSGVSKQAGFISKNNGASFTGPYQQPNISPPPALLNANFLIRGVAQSETSTSSTVTLNVPALGSSTTSTSAAGSQLRVGYAVANTTAGSAPVGTGVISYAQNGVVLTEVGVPSSPPTTHGRVFIDFRTAVAVKNSTGTINIDTGVALANGGSAAANLTITLLDTTGKTTITSGTGTLAAGAHTAQFVDQLGSIARGFTVPQDFSTATRFGTLDIVSDQPISILALRLTQNQRGDALLTSTPAADLSQRIGSSPLYFSQFVDGGGYTTMAILVNTSNLVESGKMQLYLDNGSPFQVQPVGGTPASSFAYSISPGGVFVFETDGSPSATRSGWAQITPDSGTSTPAGAGVFSFSQGGILVTQSGIPSATPTTHARIYVDMTGQHNTGLAIANPGGAALNVTVTAFQTDGTTGAGSGSVSLVPLGHAAAFAGQFISGLPSGFTGVLDISAPQPFVSLTLRSLQNSRGDFLLTTMPVADLSQTQVTPLIFPQIVDGGGYQTQIILLGTAGSSTNTVNYLGNDGAPIIVEGTEPSSPDRLERLLRRVRGETFLLAAFIAPSHWCQPDIPMLV